MSRFASASSQKQEKRESYGADRISQLPDEVLVSILSLISMKEAARTSVLSQRWKKLWTFIPNLNFDVTLRYLTYFTLQQKSELLSTSRPWVELRSTSRTRFVNIVNHVLNSYRGQSLNEFTVRFDLNDNFRGDIDRWVRFALERRVQKLQLDFSDYRCFRQQIPCSFPLLSSTRVPDCNSLKMLNLKYLNINEEVLDYFLWDCPFLEQLCLVGSNSLVHLRVVGASLRLKYLEIVDCFSLRSIKVEAMELVSFKYFGKKISLRFGKVPSLVKVSFGGQYCEDLNNFLRASSYVSQLEQLILDIPNIKADMEFLQFPTLCHLMELELIAYVSEPRGLRALISLIMASPSLCRLVLKLDCCMARHQFVQSNELSAPKCPHQCLRTVELVGFHGHIDLEIVVFLIENAVILEKIIIDTRDSLLVGSPWENLEDENVRAARNCAEELQRRYLLCDKLVIL